MASEDQSRQQERASFSERFIAALERSPIDIREATHMCNGATYAEVNASNAAGKLPLLVAAELGEGTLVLTLLDKGANIDAVERASGDTALHKAAREGKIGVVRFLIAREARSDIQNAQNETAVDVASTPRIVEIIEHGFSLPPSPSSTSTPLSLSMRRVGFDLSQSPQQPPLKKRKLEREEKSAEEKNAVEGDEGVKYQP